MTCHSIFDQQLLHRVQGVSDYTPLSWSIIHRLYTALLEHYFRWIVLTFLLTSAHHAVHRLFLPLPPTIPSTISAKFPSHSIVITLKFLRHFPHIITPLPSPYSAFPSHSPRIHLTSTRNSFSSQFSANSPTLLIIFHIVSVFYFVFSITFSLFYYLSIHILPSFPPPLTTIRLIPHSIPLQLPHRIPLRLPTSCLPQWHR